MATVRKNAFTMTKAEQDLYKAVVTNMIADGSYLALVKIHGDMSHRMHDMRKMDGRLRFLSWHRAYLVHYEAELQKKDKAAFVPYWKWVDGGVPTWLMTFKPTVDTVKNERNDLKTPITTQAHIDAVLASTDYPTFTHELEMDPHNSGHNALGMPMKSVPIAPSDPIFWMHHGEVDRTWSLWQSKNPGKGPLLTGADATMDPWTDTVSTLADISKLGYSYA